ncbi:hypothetical protein JD969_07175 [Planctomycetota bacterium]|nr:hypothetical protein JD969_07175 [Planctomycetota bacterium]
MSEETYELAGPLADYFWKKWLIGVAFSVIMTLWGVWVIVTQHLIAYGYGRAFGWFKIEVYGFKAMWIGVLFLMLAAVVHFRYFWKHTKRLDKYWQPMWYVSAVVLMVSFLLTIAIGLAMHLQFI